MEKHEAFDGMVAWYECPHCGFRPIVTEDRHDCPRCELPL
ncbi:hypothetical protein SAMN04487948_102527 [Halogranum amylolyticum]|uniref:Uncharacterized protein n=1 Tax=Halogranum amylolyticum TaxID=660520 RepID=A0A1H8PVZ8_9EURY|nr:hypothetical protein SAMN04487948_102527 [Halogranum amylolyticum]